MICYKILKNSKKKHISRAIEGVQEIYIFSFRFLFFPLYLKWVLNRVCEILEFLLIQSQNLFIVLVFLFP